MIFSAAMAVDIPIFKGKTLSMNCACSKIYSIIISGIFLYGAERTVYLVLSLSVLMFRSDIGSCSPAACVYTVYDTRSSSIFLNLLSA